MKISVIEIIKKHFSTYVNENGHKSKSDYFSMIFFPLFIALLFPIFGIAIKDSAYSNIVTISSIFTGLLLNLLVLIYDQKTKLLENKLKSGDLGYEIYSIRKNVIDEVHFNISYCILLSLLAVIYATVASLGLDLSVAIPKYNLNFVLRDWLINFPIVFLLIHIVLTLLMILKRVYKLINSH